MLRSISQNNLEMMDAALRQENFTDFVILDYGENLPSLIEHLCQVSPSVARIYAFCEHKPPASFMQRLKNLKTWEAPWSTAELRTFVTAPPSSGFENHTPIYEGDISRLPRWQSLYATGPFGKIDRKLSTLPLPGFCKKIMSHMFTGAGMLLQTMIPALRPSAGTITGTYGNTALTISFDGGPERDHYGENPLLKGRIQKLHSLLQDIGSNQSLCSAFFIGTGARHLYIEEILNTQDANRLSRFTIFCTGLYRPRAYAVTARRAGGQFYRGSNTDIYNQTIYSDHCLSVGAGDKELWYYTSPKES